MQKSGKHKTSKGCIYIKKLAEVNTNVLKEMVNVSVKYNKSKYS
ncbi:MAG: hypothetical protein WDO16_20660 [Bacteroidota bacterium]